MNGTFLLFDVSMYLQGFFKVPHACYFIENYLVHPHTKCFKNFVLSQQIQIDDGLLEGWSKWTPLILSTDTNSRGDDDSRYALLWFHTVRREPGMLQRCICCYHQQNRYTWNSAIIPISLPLLCICRNAFSLSWYSVVGQRWQIQALDGLAH